MAEMIDGTVSGARDAAEQTPQFVHLRVHSAYSLLEGALPLKKILAKATADGQPAIAITDTNNLFVALEFSQKAVDDGIQPIIGCQMSIDMQDQGEEKRGGNAGFVKLPSLILLAANATGYERLVDLVSRAYLGGEGSHQSVHIAMSWLEEGGADGIIALTGFASGPIDPLLKEGHQAQAEQRLLRLKAVFGDRLYVELQRHGNYDRRHERRLIELAMRTICRWWRRTRLFPVQGGIRRHDALMAVAHNAIVSDDTRFRLTPDHYLKSRADMAKLFADLPEALENTVEIARRCSFVLKTRKPILPRFTGATDDAEEAERAESAELRRQSVEGLDSAWQLGHGGGLYRAGLPRAARFRALGHRTHEVPGLLPDRVGLHQVGEDARYIPVGPGRGSGAGSLVAYALTIPTSIRCAFRCSSSASSTRNVCRCPTSTSTSARTAAKR